MMTAGRITTLLHLALVIVLGCYLCSALAAHHAFSHSPQAASLICDADLVGADDVVLPVPAIAGWLSPSPSIDNFPPADNLSARMLPNAIFQPPERG